MGKKLLSLILILTLSMCAIITAFATDNRNFVLTDPETDLTYHIEYSSGELAISLNGNLLSKIFIQEFTVCSLYDNILYLFTYDSFNHSITVQCFDFYGDSIASFAVNAKAYFNEHCFTSDGYGKVYFVSGNDSKTLCIYSNGDISEVSMKVQIKQLLLIDGTVIVITTDGTYLYNGSIISHTSSALSAPAHYAKDGTIIDSIGREFVYKNGELHIIGTEPATEATTQATNSYVHVLADGFYEAYEGITVRKIKKAFADLEITRFTKADKTEIKSGKLGTGATFTFSTGEVITVIIKGELTGEGNINSRDIKALLNHLSQKELLSGSALIGADVDKDGVISTKDALKIAQGY